MTATAQRVLPHDLDAEESLLGAMLLSPEAVGAAVALLGQGDFYKPVHGLIFEAISRLHMSGGAADAVTVADELRREGTLESIGDPSVLLSLQVNTPSTKNASHYAEIIARHSRLRGVIESGLALEDAAYRNDLAGIAAASKQIEAEFRQIEYGGARELCFQDIGELVQDVDRLPAPRYLVRPVIASGDYGMVSAEDKAGKTWLVDDKAVSVASGTPWLGAFVVEEPGPVLVFVGEGGKRKLIRRLRAVCESRGIDLVELPVRVCMRTPRLTSERMMAELAAEVASFGPVLVIVDPLYLAAGGARGSDLYEMGSHLERVQHICQEAGAALVIVHHWNKTGEGRGAKRMSGVGPGAWGRFLISAAVVSRHTDPVRKASDVVLDLDFQGDEMSESTFRMRRRVWVDDPDDLSSPMHY